MDNFDDSVDFALGLDAQDDLSGFRDRFLFPETEGERDVYFVGNSLGLQPAKSKESLRSVLDQWHHLAVHGHFEGNPAWIDMPAKISESMAPIVGAKPNEVVVMNTLSVNLHLMLATFYQPSGRKRKVLMEQHAFPSDQQVVESHLAMRGESNDCLLLIESDAQTQLLSTETILDTIERHRDELALILLPGVQYYTGQALDLASITRFARDYEITIGFDLAHAAGNIELKLHDWSPDFACWCTYKYLNSGPGALGACFVAERHAGNQSLPRLEGWWGHERQSRFEMKPEFVPEPSALGWQISNPPILGMAAIQPALEVFHDAGGMPRLRRKSQAMIQYFRSLLSASLPHALRVITPAVPDASGCQLSLEVHSPNVSGEQAQARLTAAGIHTDWRYPNVIRAAPVPLYNSFHDIWRFTQALEAALR